MTLLLQIKTGVDGPWDNTGISSIMTHYVGPHGDKIVGVGPDRALYLADDYSGPWIAVPGLVQHYVFLVISYYFRTTFGDMLLLWNNIH